MTARSFLDTNVLVYADDRSAGKKQTQAVKLVESALHSGRGVLSTQVLSEYVVASTRKLLMSMEAARARVDIYRMLDVVLVKSEDILAAIDLTRLHSFSFWDSLIVRAALSSGCRFLYSEDMQHGRKIDGLEIVNPFRS